MPVMRQSRPLRFAVFAFVWIVFLVFLARKTNYISSTSEFIRFRGPPSSDRTSSGSGFTDRPLSDPEPTPRARPKGKPVDIPEKQGPILGDEPKQSKGTNRHKEQQLERVNATFVTLARNSDIGNLAATIKQIEDRFNHKYNYDWVFLNDKDFDNNFKSIATRVVSGRARFGRVPSSQWSFPDHIDIEKAAKARQSMKEKKIIYGDSISYRHMCRYQSGFFFQHPLMMEYEYYWRVEPSVAFYCDMPFDPFRYMVENKKKYSFVISMPEYVETVETLWNTTKTFFNEHPEYLAKDNSMDFVSDDGGYSYNLCHFWSNFEIASLSWLRSEAYTKYFEFLDQAGGFFYERWGDAPVHSIAASLMLSRDEIHFFDEIGYFHAPFSHCPTGNQAKNELKCYCQAKDNNDWRGYSCTSKWFDFMGWERPEGFENEVS